MQMTSKLNGINVSGHRTRLLVVVLAAFFLRFYVCFFSQLPQFSTDSHTYLRMAEQILRGSPISFFPNGFPLIIVGMKSFVGNDAYLISALMALNVLMSTCVVWLAFHIGNSAADAEVGLAAALLTTFWPNQVYYSRQILSEVPASFFLMLGLLLLLRQKALFAGIVLFAAAWVRTSLAPVVILLLAICLIAPKRRNEALPMMVGFGIGFAAEFILQTTGIVEASSNFNLNFLLAISNMSTNGIRSSLVGFSEHEKAHPIATYLSFAITHPLEFLLQRLSSIYELWGPWPHAGDPQSPRSMATRLIIGLRFPLVLLALVGVWARRQDASTWILASPILTVTAIHAAFYSAEPRYTHPVEPLAIVLASIGLTALIRHKAN
jgi:hypothetical protein